MCGCQGRFYVIIIFHGDNYILSAVYLLVLMDLNLAKFVKVYQVLPFPNIILSYAFKMRQDYLSTSYLDQKYLPSERSERGRYELIQVTCAEIILSHFESI